MFRNKGPDYSPPGAEARKNTPKRSGYPGDLSHVTPEAQAFADSRKAWTPTSRPDTLGVSLGYLIRDT